MTSTQTPASFPRGWLPIRIQSSHEELQVTWAPVGQNSFSDPFFEDSVRRHRSDPDGHPHRVRTGLAALAQASRVHSGPVPRFAGFIHHWSRCGSTLAAQMLAELPGTTVLSEPPPLEALIDGFHSRSGSFAADAPEILRCLVSAWAAAFPHSQQLIIKTDAWHILDWELLRIAFPAVPAIFLYRDPVETLVSHQRRRGWHMVPGAISTNRLGHQTGTFDPSECWENHAARILAQLGKAAAQAARSPLVRLVNYSELPNIVTHQVLDHFEIHATKADRAGMLRRTRFHGKYPDERFSPDAAAKRAEATPLLIEAARAHTEAVYHELEARRASGLGLSSPLQAP